MSPILPIVSGKEVVSLLRTIDFELVSQKGSHVKLRHPTGYTVIVPMHRELAPGTFKSILRQAGLTLDDFLKLSNK